MCSSLHTSTPATATEFHVEASLHSRIEELVFKSGSLSGSDVLIIMDEIGTSKRLPHFIMKISRNQTHGPGGIIDMDIRKAACGYLGIALPPDEVFAELFRQPRVDHEPIWPVPLASALP